LSIAGPAWSQWDLNMPVGVTTTSREVYDLHMLILWVCVVIGVAVYVAMITAIVKFRKSKGAVPARWTHNGTVEVVWTVIPAVILVAMAVPAAETLIRMEDTRDSQLTIRITGYQWRWHYDTSTTASTSSARSIAKATRLAGAARASIPRLSTTTSSR
jgi:cytochrome c oxidase subunit 2